LYESDTGHAPVNRARSYALALIVFALVATACAQRSEASAAVGEATPEPTTGDQYAADIGLVLHRWTPDRALDPTSRGLTMDGVLLEGCADSPDVIEAFTVLENGHLYCYSGETDLDFWMIGERLSGHVPTAEEIEDAADKVQR
jgi:hypothetical protein